MQHENDSISLLTWEKYQEVFPSDRNFMGFSLTFFYPRSIVLLDIVDNCRCVGMKLDKKSKDDDPVWRKVNSPYWSVCMNDTTSSIENDIKESKATFKFDVKENRDTVTINNEKALRLTITNSNNEFLIQQIYFRKFGTSFEVINEKGLSPEYEIFLRTLKIQKK